MPATGLISFRDRVGDNQVRKRTEAEYILKQIT